MSFINWRELREGAAIDPLVSIGLKSHTHRHKNWSKRKVFWGQERVWGYINITLPVIFEVYWKWCSVASVARLLKNGLVSATLDVSNQSCGNSMAICPCGLMKTQLLAPPSVVLHHGGSKRTSFKSDEFSFSFLFFVKKSCAANLI